MLAEDVLDKTRAVKAASARATPYIANALLSKRCLNQISPSCCGITAAVGDRQGLRRRLCLRNSWDGRDSLTRVLQVIAAYPTDCPPEKLQAVPITLAVYDLPDIALVHGGQLTGSCCTGAAQDDARAFHLGIHRCDTS